MVLLERDLHLKALRSALSEAGKEVRVTLFIAGPRSFPKTPRSLFMISRLSWTGPHMQMFPAFFGRQRACDARFGKRDQFLVFISDQTY
jgi:hypothetical protein